MGRISKRHRKERECAANQSKLGISQSATSQPWYIPTAIYARRSSDGGSSGDSIQGQVEIGRTFMRQYNRTHAEQLELVEIYKEEGKTGTNYRRTEFQRMWREIERGGIQCVLVKDLSRLGRNYLETGEYLEQRFPQYGVRLIAVEDDYDGADPARVDLLTTEIKNLINELYARDFSIRARVHMQQRREEGHYLGGVAPYGYVCKMEKNVRSLVEDERTVKVMQWIAKWSGAGWSSREIKAELEKRNVNPPAEYRRTGEVFYGTGGWNEKTVTRIVKRMEEEQRGG